MSLHAGNDRARFVQYQQSDKKYIYIYYSPKMQQTCWLQPQNHVAKLRIFPPKQR